MRLAWCGLLLALLALASACGMDQPPPLSAGRPLPSAELARFSGFDIVFAPDLYAAPDAYLGRPLALNGLVSGIRTGSPASLRVDLGAGRVMELTLRVDDLMPFEPTPDVREQSVLIWFLLDGVDNYLDERDVLEVARPARVDVFQLSGCPRPGTCQQRFVFD